MYISNYSDTSATRDARRLRKFADFINVPARILIFISLFCMLICGAIPLKDLIGIPDPCGDNVVRNYCNYTRLIFFLILFMDKNNSNL